MQWNRQLRTNVPFSTKQPQISLPFGDFSDEIDSVLGKSV